MHEDPNAVPEEENEHDPLEKDSVVTHISYFPEEQETKVEEIMHGTQEEITGHTIKTSLQ